MTWRFSISTNGGADWSVVTPLNGSKLKVDQGRDLDAGQVFFRKKLTGKPMLGGDDFKLIDAVRRNPTRRCEELLIKCERDCGQWQEYWMGGFTAMTCDWDFDACSVGINPKTIDRYSCLLDAAEKPVNILRAAMVTVNVPFVLADLEIYACTICVPGDCMPPGDPLSVNWLWEKIAETSFVTGTPPTEDTCVVTAWGRLKITTECIDGNPTPPQGSGWALLTDDCATNGTATYVRALTGDEIFLLGAVFTSGTCVDGIATPPACVAYMQVFDCGAMTTDSSTNEEIPFLWLCFGAGGVSHERCRLLQTAAELILSESGCELTGPVSDFFEWNPPGDAPGYAPGINYVTGELSQVNHLAIEQKSDAIDPLASNPATRGEMTFTELMAMLRVMFRCYWDIDEQGILRIEHWSYWAEAQGLDISAEDAPIEPVAFSGGGQEVPISERPEFMEAQGRDFVGSPIEYAPQCSNDEPEKASPGKITTDSAFVEGDPDAISKDGFVVYACFTAPGGEYTCIVDTGALSGNFAVNVPLSWANLEDAFWRHDRYLPSGVMNEAPTDFESFLPTVQQEGVSFRACCSLLAFDPRRRINGALARRLGVLGVVESVSHDLYTDRITLVLRYPY